MNLRTPICDQFDIEVPIFLAGMGGVAYAEVCAAVSEAGGYGTLGMVGVDAGGHPRRRCARSAGSRTSPSAWICSRRFPTR